MPILFARVKANPGSVRQLAEWAATVAQFRNEVTLRWDLEQCHADVLQDQSRRRFVMGALRTGNHTPWEFAPQRDSSNEYMRNHLDLNVAERSARWPR